MADALIIHSLRYVQLPFCLSSPTQDLVVHCLSHPERIFESWEKIKTSRQKMTAELSTLAVVERVFPSSTNFLLITLKDRPKVMELLKEQNIKVLDYSVIIPSSIRVSIGTEEQNQKFLEVMRKASKG
jgi:histidinol-phosphate aminotransferase